MGNLSDKMESVVVPLDFFGVCPPAHLTFARHTDMWFVAVSREQFYAAIGNFDIVIKSMGDSETGYSSFSPRYSIEIGRTYDSGYGKREAVYLLTRAYAERRSDALEAATPVRAPQGQLQS